MNIKLYYLFLDLDRYNCLFSQISKSNPDGLYDNLAAEFAKTLDRIGMGTREDSNNGHRRKINYIHFADLLKVLFLI